MKFFDFPLTDPIFAGGLERSQVPERVLAAHSPEWKSNLYLLFRYRTSWWYG